MQKAFYGLLHSVLLFYSNLVKGLKAYMFQINPYDLCAAKNMINKKYITVVWHLFDLNISHMDIFEDTKFAGYLSSIYGEFTVHRGKLHDYLVNGP